VSAAPAPRVTIAGGGLAGMTAALRLAQRGYQVKLYEQKRILGGNVASRPGPDGVDLDIYPHMFLSWYHNLWALLRDAGVHRDESFVPFDSVKQLQRGCYPRFTELTSGFSPRYVVKNLFSGFGGPPADMFVFWYSTIDLLAEKLCPTVVLEDMSVTGFLHARPYMTERAAKTCDHFITLVWAIPAYQTCADDYRTYLAYSVSNYDPPALLAKGSGQSQVIGPLTTALERAGVDIVTEVELTSVACDDDRVTEISLKPAAGESWTEEVDELVLAVPPHVLSTLVREGGSGRPIVALEPRLAELARLRTQNIPLLSLYFKRKLRKIPPEPVGLYDSRLAIAFTDISQTWPDVPGFETSTVLAVSASDPYALPNTSDEDDGFAILRELAEYMDFEPGEAWGESPDVDWTRTAYTPNLDSQLFINETGIDIWRPTAAVDGISNVAFAGNFCVNRIGMMTVESAVASGLEAARVIVERRKLGDPVQIIEPSAGIESLYVWLRLVYGPSAMAAKAMSAGTDKLRGLWSSLMPTEATDAQRRDS
jgi:protoporphyrinogen oxidase